MLACNFHQNISLKWSEESRQDKKPNAVCLVSCLLHQSNVVHTSAHKQNEVGQLAICTIIFLFFFWDFLINEDQ